MLDMTTAELLISKNREKILTSLTSKLKDQFMKASVDFDFAFKSYLSKSYEKYTEPPPAEAGGFGFAAEAA